MISLHIRLLGGFALNYDGQPLLAVDSPRLQSLLAYLVLHPDTASPREHLAFILWPDSSEGQAHTNLRKRLHELRHALPVGEDWLLGGSQAVQWNPDAPFTLDVASFEASAGVPESLAGLERAVDLYAGDLLPGCYDDWILPERERLRQEFIGLLERLVALLEERGDYTAATGYARRQLQCDPLREETYRLLMRLAARAGDRAQVAWVYKTCSTVLQRELDVEPSAETRDVYTRCLELSSARPVLDQSAAPGEAHPNNLPFQVSSLIGREREREEIGRLVAGNRLVTLTGPPGVGKTRLAMQVAADILARHRDGAWFVELAALHDPNLLISRIAQAFGLKEIGSRPIHEILKQHLEDKELLLVLDNFEHLVAAADEVHKLLAGCSHLNILVTSRVPLRLTGEHEYQVPPLSVPGRDQLAAPSPPGDAVRFESVRLFVERVKAVQSSFEVTSSNVQAVGEICARLDGLPLAIELAAARIRTFPPQALLARLDHRLRLLSGGARDLPARQQTLRAAIEWSYDLLDEGEKQLLRRLAVFEGGSSFEAIEAVCGGAAGDRGSVAGDSELPAPLQVDVLDGIDSLVSKSLLRQQEGVGGEPRFSMLQTIHEFAGERLEESGEAEALGRRHVEYFLSLAEQAEPELTGQDQVTWLARLEDENDNLRAALRRSAEAGLYEENLRLAGVLWRFWVLRGYFAEEYKCLDKSLALGQTTSQPVLAKARYAAGALAAHQGNLDLASTHDEEALRLFRVLGDRKLASWVLNDLGLVALNRGDYQLAQQRWEESLALKREVCEKWDIAINLDNLGQLLLAQGEYEQAFPFFEEALVLSREGGERDILSTVLHDFGFVHLYRGDRAQARQVLDEGLAMCRQMQDVRRTAESLLGFSALAEEQGELEKAARLLSACQAMRDALHSPFDYSDQVLHDRTLEALQRRLDPARLTALLEEGRRLDPEQAAEYALNSED